MHEETSLSPFTPNQIDPKMCNLPSYGIPLKLIGRNILQDGFEYSLSCATCFLTWRECMYVKCIQNPAGSTATVFSKKHLAITNLRMGKARSKYCGNQKHFIDLDYLRYLFL